jgi:hypothetical protein
MACQLGYVTVSPAGSLGRPPGDTGWMPEDVPLGSLLRRHRRAAGLTLEEAADVSAVSARAISWCLVAWISMAG